MSSEFIAAASLLDKKESDQLSNALLLQHYCHVHDLRKASLPAQTATNQILYKVNFYDVSNYLRRLRRFTASASVSSVDWICVHF